MAVRFLRSIRRPSRWSIAWLGFVGLGLLFIFLLSPVYYFTYGDDDQLMVNMAGGFIAGHWSSTWAVTGIATMAKPVGYALFLAAVHYVPWSPTVSVYLLYLVGAVAIAWSWKRISGSNPQATLILGVLVLNPIAFTWTSLRIYRDFFMTAIVTLAIGVAFILAARSATSWSRSEDHRNAIAVSGAPRTVGGRRIRWVLPYLLVTALGLIIGLTAITKPGWTTLLPAILAPVVYPAVQLLRSPRRTWPGVIRIVLAAVLLAGSAWAVISVTKFMDQRRYHVALVEDLSQGSLARTWKLWASVQAGPPVRFVPITKAMRLAVYRVSPTAAEMRPFLESPQNFWKKVDCESTIRICDESGPWFNWDMLSAAQSTGKVNSVKQLQDFYTSVADQIDRACHDGRLHCTTVPVLAPGLPPLNQIPLTGVIGGTASGLWQLVGGTLPMERPFGPVPDRATYKLWASVVPDMQPFSIAAKGDTPSGVYELLRILNQLYRVLNIGLLAIIGAGVVLLVARKLGRRRRVRAVGIEMRPMTIAILCVVSTTLGMATLAVFAAAQYPGFVTAKYWSDFASISELALVFGAIAFMPALANEYRRWKGEHKRQISGGEPAI